MARSTDPLPLAFTLPNIPLASDLKSTIVAVNALRQAVQLIAGQMGRVPHSEATQQQTGTAVTPPFRGGT